MVTGQRALINGLLARLDVAVVADVAADMVSFYHLFPQERFIFYSNISNKEKE